MQHHYTNFKSISDAISMAEKINPETDIEIKLISSYDNAKYYSSNIKIEGKSSKISFAVSKVNMKLRPQTLSKDGKLTKVKASFMIDDAGDVGKLFKILDEKFLRAMAKTFPKKSLIHIGIVQSEINSVNKEGIEESKKIDKEVGWICLKNMMKPVDRSRFNNNVTIVQNTESGVKVEELKQPAFEELQKFWPHRALVSGYINLENITYLDTKVLFTVTFANKPITLLPIPSETAVDQEQINDMIHHAQENKIMVETPSDFSPN